MFQEASVWELRLGKVASVVFTGLFSFLVISNLEDFTEDEWWHLAFDYSAYTAGFLFYSSLIVYWIFFKNPKAEAKYYPIALLISIVLINYAMFVDFHLMHPPVTQTEDPKYLESLGRQFYYTFMPLPIILVFALLHLRVWAVLLFMALSITPNFLKAIWIIQHPNTTLARGMENLSHPSVIDAGFLGGMGVISSLAVVATIGLLFFNNYALGMAQKIERSNALLGRYFAPDIREEIEASDLDLTEQEPKEQLVAILFTDIAGFTKLSETMDPRDVMRLLSTYQSMMVSSIFAHSGTVDKFIGDAVMANFGTPRSHGNDAQNAYNCALEMHEKVAAWNVERRTAGLSEVHHRIGIHFGTCVVGNTGSEQRTEFAVIGDAVNVASRVCEAGKTLKTDFVISSDFYDQITPIEPMNKVNAFEIRGRKEPIDLMIKTTGS